MQITGKEDGKWPCLLSVRTCLHDHTTRHVLTDLMWCLLIFPFHRKQVKENSLVWRRQYTSFASKLRSTKTVLKEWNVLCMSSVMIEEAHRIDLHWSAMAMTTFSYLIYGDHKFLPHAILVKVRVCMPLLFAAEYQHNKHVLKKECVCLIWD